MEIGLNCTIQLFHYDSLKGYRGPKTSHEKKASVPVNESSYHPRQTTRTNEMAPHNGTISTID